MKPSIRRIHSPDVSDLEGYRPDDPSVFGFLAQVMIGPANSEGEESFDITVCSPKWLLEQYARQDVIFGRHHLIMLEYDFARMMSVFERLCNESEAPTWGEVAAKLGRFAKWEFEDYRESGSETSASHTRRR